MAALSYRLYPEENLLVVDAQGLLSLGDLFGFLQTLLEDPDYKLGMNCVWDAREATSAEGDISLYQKAAELVSDERVFKLSSRTAILINSSNQEIFQYAQGFLLMASSSKIDHRVFTDDQFQQALDFLGISSIPD